MIDEAVAHRYAEALYGMAAEAGRVEPQLKDLETVLDLLKGHDRLRGAIDSPAVPSAVKKSIFRRLLEKKVERTTLHFLYLLVDKGREAHLPGIVEAFRKMMREAQGIVECRVEVASPLSQALRTRLIGRLAEYTGKKVELSVQVVPELLAGAVITVGDQRIDGSLQTHLSELKARLVGA